jgi:hypothetical protein
MTSLHFAGSGNSVQQRYTRNDLSFYLVFANSLIRCILLPLPTCAYLTSIYLRTWFCWQTHNPLVPCSTHGRPTSSQAQASSGDTDSVRRGVFNIVVKAVPGAGLPVSPVHIACGNRPGALEYFLNNRFLYRFGHDGEEFNRVGRQRR